jgi:hypothetical protein
MEEPLIHGGCAFSPGTCHLTPETLGASAVVAATIDGRFGMKGKEHGQKATVCE